MRRKSALRLRYPNRNLQNTFAARLEQIVCLRDIIERKGVGQQRPQIDSMCLNETHEPPHTLLSSGTERGGNRLIAQAGAEGIKRDREVARVNADTGEHAGRSQYASQKYLKF